MESKRAGAGDHPQGRAAPRGRLQVEDGGVRRPFMRGIMIHSLMARGVSFEDAYRTAERVREQVREQGVVRAEELNRLVRKILGGDALGSAAMGPVPEPILVTTPGRAQPFSKETLAQSLLAASLDPGDAFEVAREIELDLLRRGELEIERRALRQRAYSELLERFGSTPAERYLVWRHYQEPRRPVIILLGGTTGAGKTSVALEVARRLGIRRVLSTDSIRQVMRIMLSAELMPALHTSSFDAHRFLPFASASEEPEVEGFLAQATTVSVGVRAIMERAVSENTSIVIDGVALAPGLIDCDVYAERAHVIPMVIATLDVEAFAGRFEARGDSQKEREPHRYLPNIEAILRIQDHYLELADRHGVPIVDNQSIESSVQLIIRHTVETLRKKGEIDVGALL